MSEILCPFGPFIVACRRRAQVSQWDFAVATNINVTNLRKIEKGRTQPGILTAVFMVSALKLHPGPFFEILSRAGEGLTVLPSALDAILFSTPGPADDELLRLEIASGVRCIFGPLLKHVRSKAGVSQRRIAELCDLGLRGILRIESGEREPGVMNALKLVYYTGYSVARFFDSLTLLCSSRIRRRAPDGTERSVPTTQNNAL